MYACQNTRPHTHTCVCPASTSHPSESPLVSTCGIHANPSASVFLCCPSHQPPPSLACISTRCLSLVPLPPLSLQALFLITAKETFKVPSIGSCLMESDHCPALPLLLKPFKSLWLMGYHLNSRCGQLPLPHISAPRALCFSPFGLL